MEHRRDDGRRKNLDLDSLIIISKATKSTDNWITLGRISPLKYARIFSRGFWCKTCKRIILMLINRPSVGGEEFKRLLSKLTANLFDTDLNKLPS